MSSFEIRISKYFNLFSRPRSAVQPGNLPNFEKRGERSF